MTTDRRADETPAHPKVGRRLRALREAQGVSLREQARRIGISAASLSQLETDRGGWSLRLLQRAADHYGVPVSELLAERAGQPAPDAEAGVVEIVRDCSSAASIARGPGARSHPLGNPVGHQLQPYLLTLDPGGGFADDTLEHAGEEFAYVLHGTVVVLVDGDEHVLRQGDLARFRADRPHGYRNGSEHGPAVALVGTSPPW